MKAHPKPEELKAAGSSKQAPCLPCHSKQNGCQSGHNSAQLHKEKQRDHGQTAKEANEAQLQILKRDGRRAAGVREFGDILLQALVHLMGVDES